MTERPKTIITLLMLGIAALLIVTLHTNRRVASLEAIMRQMDVHQHLTMGNTQNINTTIWDLSGRVDALSEEIMQAARLSFNQQVLIQSYDREMATAEVLVSFYLREYTPGDVVSVIAAGQGGQVYSAYANTGASTPGRFMATIALPVQDNYIFTFATYGDTVTTGELTQLNLADMLCGRFTFFTNQSQTRGPNQPTTVTLWPEFRNDTQGNPALEVVSLMLLLEADGEVIRTWDIMPHWDDLDGYGTGWFVDHMGVRVLRLSTREEGLSFTFGHGVGEVDPSATLMTRLVVYDNLGLRYEQVDQVFAYWAGHDSWGTYTTAETREVPWPDADWANLGRMRIVD